LGRQFLDVKMGEEPNDLCLAILHTYLLRAWVEAKVVLGFFGRLFLDCFQLGFIASWWVGLPEEA
jgi:hypothetical protein